MAEELYDGVFWLPSEFLTDDDLLMDFKSDGIINNKKKEDFTSEFGFNSDLSSPVDSLLGSIETEIDEDASMAWLTQKMANSTLMQSNFPSDETAKGWKLCGSPQSTLFLGQSGLDFGSPNSISRVSSPPECNDAVRLNLMYAAREEVNKRRMLAETTAFCTTKRPIRTHPRVPLQNQNSAIDFYGNQIEAHISYRRQQQARLINQQQQTMSGWGKLGYRFQNEMRNGVAGRRPAGGSLMAAGWPMSKQLHLKPGSVMRAGSVGETGVKKERTGTGVFIPRSMGTSSTEAGCSVQLPDRVVHALNLNLDSMEYLPQHRVNGNFTWVYDAAALKHMNSHVMAQQHIRNFRVKQPLMHQEMQIPSE